MKQGHVKAIWTSCDSRHLTKGADFNFRGRFGVTGSILVVLEASRFWSVPTLVAGRVGKEVQGRLQFMGTLQMEGEMRRRDWAAGGVGREVGTALRTPVNPLVIRDIAACGGCKIMRGWIVRTLQDPWRQMSGKRWAALAFRKARPQFSAHLVGW